jgi:anti-sigma factor RsiW
VSTIDPPEDLLSAYLDDEVTPDERATVDAHLETSAEWREILTELRESRALLRGLPTREAPTGFWDGVLQPDIAPPVSIDRERRRRRGAKVVGWLAGAAAAAAIAAVVLVPGEARVKPAVGTLVSTHAARSSQSDDPTTQLAPVAMPMRLRK